MNVALAAANVECSPMSAVTRAEALALLGAFLAADGHYLASSAAYGDGGIAALSAALDLFLARPELGFVWLACVDGATGAQTVGACVVCYAISTSRGRLVAKLDDVTIADGWRGRGIGGALLESLARELSARGFGRIDTACHRDNGEAWRFYQRHGFVPLNEERIARLL